MSSGGANHGSLVRQAADMLLEEARARAAIGASAPGLDPVDVAYLLTATAAVIATTGPTPAPAPPAASARQGSGPAEHPVDFRDEAGNRRLWLTVDEVQRVTGISQTEVYVALQTGALEGSQRTRRGRWRVHRDALAAWLGTGQ